MREERLCAQIVFRVGSVVDLRFESSQGLGSDRRIDGVQHVVHQAVLQRPAYRKQKPPLLCNFAAILKCFGEAGSLRIEVQRSY